MHHRLGYLKNYTINEMIKNNSAIGLPKTTLKEKSSECEECIKNKMVNKPHKNTNNNRSIQLGDLLLMDLSGPYDVDDNFKRFYLLIIDDHTRYIWIYIIFYKNEAMQHMINLIKSINNKYNITVKAVRTDNGSEFVNSTVTIFFNSYEIEHQKTTIYSPESNGITERYNRTVKNMIRCLLNKTNLPAEYWTEAAKTSVYILNRCLSTKNKIKSAYELLNKRKPSLKHMKIFGCKCFYIIKNNKNKLLPRSKIAIFLGYNNEHQAYNLLDINTREIKVSRDVKFIENVFPTLHGNSSN